MAKKKKKRTRKSSAPRKSAASSSKKRARSAGGRVTYSEEMRREVAEYSILHGIHAAAKKYSVSAPSVTNWRKAYGITRATKRAAQSGRKPRVAAKPQRSGAGRVGYPESLRREVAEYSIVHGIQAAAKQYSVSAPSVTNWRKTFGITRADKVAALSRAANAPSGGASRFKKGDVEKVRKHFEQAFRSLDQLLAKL